MRNLDEEKLFDDETMGMRRVSIGQACFLSQEIGC